MTRTRQSLRYKILLGVMCAVLGHLGVFNTSASAQRYMFGRADFAAASQDQTLGGVATGDFNGDGILDVAVTIAGGRCLLCWATPVAPFDHPFSTQRTALVLRSPSAISTAITSWTWPSPVRAAHPPT